MKAHMIALAALIAATPALAQEHQHHHDSAASAGPAAEAATGKDSGMGMEGHDHHQMQAPTSPQPAAEPAPQGGHAHHQGHGGAAASSPQGAPPPVDPGFAGDAYFDPQRMAAQRKALFDNVRGHPITTILLERFEYAARDGEDGYVWEGKAWLGSETDRLLVRTKGEGAVGGAMETAELQGLWSHAIDPWFNLELGLRHDIRPGPQRSYAVVGIDGLAPYWIEVEGGLYLSDKGDAHARIELSHDMRLTQRLLFQPTIEVEVAAQDVPELGVGSGLSHVELGGRIRYEIRREFAPYIGISWERSVGDTARYARSEGEHVSTTSIVAGIRFWF